MRICAITNVYNESFNLPIWLSYYGLELGLENCVVVDHGSDDGSTDDLRGASKMKIPRDKLSEMRRANFISELASSMLRVYDVVIYSDCDEILIPDPAKFAGLADFCAKVETPCVTAIGLNLVHNIQDERLIDVEKPILGQRAYVQFVSPMCKSLLIRSPVVWRPGFHSSNLQPAFSDLYLFHTRWLDMAACLRRLDLTRTIEFERGDGPAHHHHPMTTFIETFQHLAHMPRTDDFDIGVCLENVVKLFKRAGDGQFVIDGDWRSPKLIRVPERFRGVF